MKKLLALLLVFVLVIGLFAGCAKKEETQEPAPSTSETPEKTETPAKEESEAANDDLVTFEIYAAGAQTKSSLDSAVGQYIAEKFGIEFMLYGYPGDETEKMGMMLAGGDYGDIQNLNSGTMIKNYIEAGALINLDDYKDLLPNFYALYEDIIPYWRLDAPDGGLYTWRCCTDQSPVSVMEVMVRSDVLEYYGYPEILTEQEWLDFLTQAMKDFPTSFNGEPTSGMVANMADEWFRLGCVAELYGTGEQYFAMANEPWLYNLAEKKAVSWAHEPAVKESLKFWNGLYKNGVLDPECLTDNGDAVLAKMSDGRALAAYYSTWNMGQANAALIEAGHPEMQWVCLPIQTTGQVERGEGRAYMTTVAGQTYHSHAVTVNCPDVERYLKFLDWCCTEEGVTVINDGLEGVHWERDASGKRVFTEYGLQVYQGQTDGFEMIDDHSWNFPLIDGQWENGEYRNMNSDPVLADEFGLTDRQKEVYAAMGYEYSSQWWYDHAVIYDGTRGWLTPSAQPATDTDMGKAYAELKDTAIKHTAGIVFSDDFDAAWDAFITEWEKTDYQAVIDYMNAELDRMCEELGLIW